jgi:small GTP-binding protein
MLNNKKTNNLSIRDIKVIIIGDVFTGKTCFVNRWATGKYNENYKETIPQNLEYKIVKKKDILWRINIWDIGGQDRNRIIAKFFFNGCHSVIIFCDITNENSIQNTLLWKNSLKDLKNEFNYPIYLIQSKIDLVTQEKLDETLIRMQKFSYDNQFDFFFRVSSKNGFGINESMEKIIDEVINRLYNCQIKENDNINLNKNKINKNDISMQFIEEEVDKSHCC